MNIIKHAEFFDPSKVTAPIHIIGLGAVGSTLAEMMVRIGFEDLYLYDFDTVTEHNLANQMFRFKDIGDTKLNAVSEILSEINPDLVVHAQAGYFPDKPHAPLNGFIFLCVDNIDLRRAIVEENLYNPTIVAMFDFRMRLTDAQHYAAEWSNPTAKKNFLATMQFSHDEAKEATPVSACGTTLSIVPTVRTLVSVGVANFINFTKTGVLKHMCLIDPFNGILDQF